MASDEINVSSMRGIGFVVSEAAKRLESSRRVTLCGINFAMPRLVQAVELLKHSLKGLHQTNHFERVADTYKTRLVVTLSLTELDNRTKGYQAPLPFSQVQERPISEIAKVPERKPRPERTGETLEEGKTGSTRPPRAGRRGRGRGRGRRPGPGPRQGEAPRAAGDNPRGPRRKGGRALDRQAVGQDKYVRVQKKLEEEKLEDNEIRVLTKLPVEATVKKAVLLLKRSSAPSIHLKATGSAIPQAVAIAEAIRRGVAGLHQLTTIGKVEVTDVYVPTEEGLTEIVKTRQITTLEITLSKIGGNKSHYGYQEPLPADQVKEISVEEAERTS